MLEIDLDHYGSAYYYHAAFRCVESIPIGPYLIINYFVGFPDKFHIIPPDASGHLNLTRSLSPTAAGLKGGQSQP
jgi:hypothetical protein